MADIPSKLNRPGPDKATHIRLKRSAIFPETEEFIFKQAKVIITGNYLKYITKDTNVMSDACRFGGPSSETIQRVMSKTNPKCLQTPT
jgi:hypothetical protein